MKRILFITRTDPYLRAGGDLLARAYISGFNELFNGNVDLILSDCCHIDHSILPVQTYTVSSRNQLLRLASLFTGSLHRFKGYVMNFLSERAELYSMCVFDGSILAGDMIDFVNSLGIKTVTIHQNYEKEYHMDNKTILCFKGFFPYYVINNERNAYLKSSLNIFLTKNDEHKLVQIYGNSKGINRTIGCFEPHKKVFVGTACKYSGVITLIISGSMNSYQTIIGVEDFYNNYYSIAKEICSDVKVILTGRNPDNKILKIVSNEKSNMQVIANPDDIFEIVSRGSIFLCPTCIGGGIKLRLMDGLKVGLPILVHEISARGYDAFFAKPWYKIYRDEESFKIGFTSLINFIKSGNYEASEIQQAYTDEFSFDAGVRRLSDFIRQSY